MTLYTYDNRNRLVDVLFKNSAGVNTLDISYVYDNADELIKRTVTPYANGGVVQPATTQQFACDQGHVAAAFTNGSMPNSNFWLTNL